MSKISDNILLMVLILVIVGIIVYYISHKNDNGIERFRKIHQQEKLTLRDPAEFDKHTSEYVAFNSKDEKEQDRLLDKMMTARPDFDEFLIFHRCIQVKPGEFAKVLANICHTDGFVTDAPNFSKIQKKIIDRINLFHSYVKKGDSKRPLRGPILVTISQAPYYPILDSKCKVSRMSPVGGWIADNKYRPRNVFQRDCPNIRSQPLRYAVNLIYLAYAKYNPASKSPPLQNANVLQTLCNFNNAIRPYVTKKDLCRIRCGGEQNKVCGCLNIRDPYIASCNSTKTPNSTKSEIFNIITIYDVNPNSKENTNNFWNLKEIKGRYTCS